VNLPGGRAEVGGSEQHSDAGVPQRRGVEKLSNCRPTAVMCSLGDVRNGYEEPRQAALLNASRWWLSRCCVVLAVPSSQSKGYEVEQRKRTSRCQVATHLYAS